MTSNVRERKVGANGTVEEKHQQFQAVEREDKIRISVLDVLRLLAGLLLLNCSLSYFITNDTYLWGWRPWFLQPKLVQNYFRGPLYLTDAQLAIYNGTDSSLPIYLALNGTIYDVTSGARTYGPGGSYHTLAAKDATRAFITGCFAEDGVPDLRGAEWTYISTDVPSFDDETIKIDKDMKLYREQELRKARKKVKETIEGWEKMYSGKDGKDYFAVGTVKREPGWLEEMPRRRLCKVAEDKRPKPQATTDP